MTSKYFLHHSLLEPIKDHRQITDLRLRNNNIVNKWTIVELLKKKNFLLSENNSHYDFF